MQEKGSKRVMLKNIQEAKFESILVPVAARVLQPKDKEDLSFDYFFMHILAHELSHGIGPHQIQIAGRDTSPRQELKELYSAIEEAKADVTGLFMMQYFFDHGMAHGTAAERQLYTTFLASAFRSVRFASPRPTAKAWRCNSTTSWIRARSLPILMGRSPSTWRKSKAGYVTFAMTC
ncbi:MAG: hypothetical protein WDO73_03550 [Ignavibacteriota bacterium]